MIGAYSHVGLASVAVLGNVSFGVISALNIMKGVVQSSSPGLAYNSSLMIGALGLLASVVFGKLFINQLLYVGALPEYRLARADSLSARVEGFDGALRFLGVKTEVSNSE